MHAGLARRAAAQTYREANWGNVTKVAGLAMLVVNLDRARPQIAEVFISVNLTNARLGANLKCTM